jgi:uncharacterized LabA/DUF88 family protein
VSTTKPSNRMIVYVDGFNLYHGLHSSSAHRNLWLDLPKLARSLRPQTSLISVKYFTASVLNEPAAQSRQDTYIAALTAAYPELVEVTMGRYQQKIRRCRNCDHPWHLYEEKETDVNIAVNLVADAAAARADTFLVMSADSDIAPAVRMAQRLNPGAFFLAAFPPKRFSNELKTLMPVSFQIGRGRISGALLPDSVTAADGVTHRRPDKWR